MTKPTIAVVPGAWHAPAHFQEFTDLLEKAGYPTKTLQLPSSGSSNPNDHTVETDAEAIRQQLLLPLLDGGNDVVLVLHSFAGSPGSVAAKGLSKKERTSGGGIIGLVCIAAFLAAEGASLLSAFGGQFEPWVQVDEATGQLTVDNPTEVFYNDLPADRAAKAVSNVQPHSKAALSSPSSAPAWAEESYNGRRTYFLARNDNAVKPVFQEKMMEKSGVEWNVKELDAGHSPFLSRTQELVDGIVEAIAKY